MLHAPPALPLSPSPSLSFEFPQRALSAQKLHKAARVRFFPLAFSHFPSIFQLPQNLSALPAPLLGQVSVNSARQPQLGKALGARISPANTFKLFSVLGFSFWTLNSSFFPSFFRPRRSCATQRTLNPFCLLLLFFPFSGQ